MTFIICAVIIVGVLIILRICKEDDASDISNFVISKTKPESTLKPKNNKIYVNGRWLNIDQVNIDDYDNNIADYERNHTGIPLAFLVQMCYSDVSCKKREPKTVFAENMLQNVMHRPVLLSDGTLCSLEYLLLNDLSHSIILENGIGKRMKDSIEPAWFIPQIRKEKAQTRQSTLEPEAEDTQELTETEQAADSAPTEDSALETAKAD